MTEHLEPLITNERGQREWEWIVTQVGEPAARAAMALLKGQRPYPLNIARKLGLALPKALADAPPSAPEVAQRHLDLAFTLLGRKPGGTPHAEA